MFEDVTVEILKNAKRGSIFRQLYDEKVANAKPEDIFISDSSNPEEALVKMRMKAPGKVVLFGGVYLLNNYPELKQQRITDSFPITSGFGFPKNSEFSETFDYHIQTLHESGLMHKYHLKWFQMQPLTHGSVNDNEEESGIIFISAGYLILPFSILMIGIAIGILYACVEKIMDKFTN